MHINNFRQAESYVKRHDQNKDGAVDIDTEAPKADRKTLTKLDDEHDGLVTSGELVMLYKDRVDKPGIRVELGGGGLLDTYGKGIEMHLSVEKVLARHFLAGLVIQQKGVQVAQRLATEPDDFYAVEDYGDGAFTNDAAGFSVGAQATISTQDGYSAPNRHINAALTASIRGGALDSYRPHYWFRSNGIEIAADEVKDSYPFAYANIKPSVQLPIIDGLAVEAYGNFGVGIQNTQGTLDSKYNPQILMPDTYTATGNDATFATEIGFGFAFQMWF